MLRASAKKKVVGFEDDDYDEDDDVISPITVSRRENGPARNRRRLAGDFSPSVRSDLQFSYRYHGSVIATQTSRLLDSLLHGTPIWFFKFVRLMAFSFALMPAFVQFAWYYLITADRVAFPYKVGGGVTSRHFLDIYGTFTVGAVERGSTTGSRGDLDEGGDDGKSAAAQAGGKPVVIFIPGGAWIIGYKMWGTLLARALVPLGLMVVIPDYRNYPQVNIGDMIRDVDYAIQWVLDNIWEFGGDPSRVVLVGQSAGAHLGSCIMLEKAISEVTNKHTSNPVLSTTYKASDLRGFVPVSGPYNMVSMRGHFHKHGLDRGLLLKMFDKKVECHSPVHLLLRFQRHVSEAYGSALSKPSLECALPPLCIVHGTSDETVPFEQSTEFVSHLQKSKAALSTITYEGWGHTDAIIEAPFDGDNRFHRDVYNLVKLWTDGDSMGPFDESLPSCRRMCPRFLVAIGRFLNPF